MSQDPVFTWIWIFKARSHLTLEFTRTYSQVGNRGCKPENNISTSVLWCSLSMQNGKILLKIWIFSPSFLRWHHWQHWTYILHGSSCLYPQGDEAEAGPGPQLHSTRSMLPGPRGLGVCELPAITSDTAHGMARDGKLEIIWPGPRRPLPGTVKPPQKINGGNFSIEEREGSPNLANLLDVWPRLPTPWFFLVITHWCLYLWKESNRPRNTDFFLLV